MFFCDETVALLNVPIQAKLLAVEMFKWIRDVLRTQLQNIKPVQVL